MEAPERVSGAGAIAAALDALAARAVERCAALTERGATADDHQVIVERVAYAATEARVARELHAAASEAPALAELAAAGVAELAASARDRLARVAPELGLGDADLAAVAAVLRTHHALGSEAAVRAIGGEIVAAGVPAWPHDAILDEVRTNVRQFAEREIAPHAERIHAHDELIPERFIQEMGRLGYFGLSVPEAYGGHELGNLAMILTTEELSRVSLAAAGSLITRPEILAKALLAGGTEAQKRTWLPRIASGEVMVAISVTEPDVGSDVAAVKCRAEPRTVGGVDGWILRGAKAWCTFAGRADVLALLARTDPDPAKGARGLSLFIVDKPRHPGHDFEVVQSTGGRLTGKADRTPGYRGMHSFTLQLDDYFVPADQLVGETEGVGRGFYLQMAGFAAGRLQTGGRACGLMAAALERTADYTRDRRQFGRAIGDYGLTRYHLGRMAVRLAAARAVTYAAARAMDSDERAAAPLAAQAKLFACDAAVEVTQLGQLLHGGWGYAEEYPISRYVVDAQVLPIFEGVKPILTLKVVGRALLGGA
jgi:(2S)-methylsuccinyl-CoA dehydrogenase